jgi:hypothetical protein
MLKADATKKRKAPFWLLMDGVLTYARRAEKDTQTGHPALLDEFYKIFSNLWGIYSSHRSPIFLQQDSMMTLASQCGLHHYLRMKLAADNIIPHKKDKRPLLDYALVPIAGAPLFLSVDVVTTLLEFGADPNDKCGGEWTPWQNALSYIHVTVPTLSPDIQVAALHLWASVIEHLLQAGADPNTGCLEPERFRMMGRHRTVGDQLYPAREVITKTFASHLQLQTELGRIMTLMDQKRKQHKRSSCRPQ